jgi:hypothetical protein
MSNTKGYVVYEGPSLFDGKPIVGIVTMKTSNKKTGNMAQLWILRSDIEPHVAVKTGDDQSVCGGCKHRPANDNTCYVTVFQAPLSVYRAYKRGIYSKDTPDLSNSELRVGAYGDGAMLPPEVLDPLVESAKSNTGYSHQWKNKRLTHALKHSQASVDSVREALEFKRRFPKGKYFRVTHDISDIMENEVECLADSKGITCQECMICNGKTKDVVIQVHGSKASRFKPEISVVEM